MSRLLSMRKLAELAGVSYVTVSVALCNHTLVLQAILGRIVVSPISMSAGRTLLSQR
ncbi:MAG: hypothetical protein SNJ52_03185 [Verrucomicrobiia bacterium]